MSGSAVDGARTSWAPARGIRARGLVVFYMTSIVGAGILIGPGIAARKPGPVSLVVWAVPVSSFPIAVMFAQMSARRPDCGGIAALIRAGRERR
jgi:amino acid efflux transporter